MESDPGREGCPIALQTSDAWEVAVAGEAQMTWLTYREKGALRVLSPRIRQGTALSTVTLSTVTPWLRCLLMCPHWAPMALPTSL